VPVSDGQVLAVDPTGSATWPPRCSRRRRRGSRAGARRAGWRTPRCGSSSASRSAPSRRSSTSARGSVRAQRAHHRRGLGRRGRARAGPGAVRAGGGGRGGARGARRRRHRAGDGDPVRRHRLHLGARRPPVLAARDEPGRAARPARGGSGAWPGWPGHDRRHDLRLEDEPAGCGPGRPRSLPRRPMDPGKQRRFLAEQGLAAPHYPRPYGIGGEPGRPGRDRPGVRPGRPGPVHDGRRRVGAAHDPGPRHRRAARGLRRADLARRHHLVPAVLRAGRRLGPRVAAHPRDKVDGGWLVNGQKVWTSWRQKPTGRSAWPAPTPTPRSTRASATSSSTCAAPASTSARCAKPTAATCSTRSSSPTSSSRTPGWSAPPARAGGWPAPRSATSASTSPPAWERATRCPPTTSRRRRPGPGRDARRVRRDHRRRAGLRRHAPAAAAAPDRRAAARRGGERAQGRCRLERYRLRRAVLGWHGPDAATLGGPAGDAAQGYLSLPPMLIGGGTLEIQLNVIGEQVLGLPR
jgi:hypothetical protein